jgi:hypothetical protein
VAGTEDAEMNRRQMVVANVQYRKPTLEGSKQTKGLLRYYTYRDGRTGQVIQKPGLERWVDHGLGQTMTDIAASCERLKGEHVLAFTMVINPNPELVQMMPVASRAQFVRDLTQTTLDSFFEARGIDTGIESSYVLHHRNSENRQSPGLHNPHTHVLLPGTYFDEGKGERVPLYFSRNRKVDHIDMLHRSAEASMAELLEQYVGRDWEQRMDALEAVRAQQRAIVQTAPHLSIADEQGIPWDTWIGVRRTTAQHAAVGYYRYYPKDEESAEPTLSEDAVKLEFRPLIRGLEHHHADLLASIAAQHCRELPGQSPAAVFLAVQQLADLTPQALVHQYAQFIQQLPYEVDTQGENPQPARDIGF